MRNTRIVQNRFCVSLVYRRPVDRLREYEEEEVTILQLNVSKSICRDNGSGAHSLDACTAEPVDDLASNEEMGRGCIRMKQKDDESRRERTGQWLRPSGG